ncbi:alpha-amylase family protein [Paraburkholderia dioscoreae]|uniref:Uncharacterized protein n=1 Tax=Paraburkholderia dioscoreae TaxID=2604047 RepID=A0A5Q4ZR20_9BURK|nr:hypothetical protein [Paraburkholderia dioscoreae]VVD31180.1 conserved exported protein of unknown function [Paraburkholderia dioscoreae]
MRQAGVLARGFAALCLAALAGCQSQPASEGIVWQIDNQHNEPHGDWNRLGVTDLLIQWTAVDDTAFVSGTTLREAQRLPDWRRIAAEPWANSVLVGLAGRFDERAARANATQLVEQSLQLVAAAPPLHIEGWYFPVEVDPSWQDARSLAPLLERLPRPLWISVYDRSNIGGKALADWLDSWLPHDVGVLFQDGVGVYAREPRVARDYADALAVTLGKARVRVIAEVFRPGPNQTFRSATAAELMPQLKAYHGYRTYLFDGPHYVSPELVEELLK